MQAGGGTYPVRRIGWRAKPIAGRDRDAYSRSANVNDRFVRCPHCQQPHDLKLAVCPRTGKKLSPQVPPPDASQPTMMRTPIAPAKKRVWDDLVGTVISGRYVVESVLGQGGMGTVFQALHTDLDRPVAIKVLNPQQAAKTSSVQRFHNEARSSGAIGHPNICEVYDLGTLPSGSPFLVMEYITGETLAARVGREKGLPVLDAIDILAGVLAGLSAAHAKSIVHRDIKPENIMLITTPRPGVKILDFGVSKMLGPDPYGEGEDVLSLTRTGMVMGTPYYMSAEQARGDRDLDARVDVYACGVMLYEALAGKRPYTAPNYNALLLQIVGKPPTPLRQLVPTLPERLEAIVVRAMERDRNVRYQSAAEFRAELLAFREEIAPKTKSPPRERTVPADLAREANRERALAESRNAQRSETTHRGLLEAAETFSGTVEGVSETERPPPTEKSAEVPASKKRREALDFDDAPTQVYRPDAPPPGLPPMAPRMPSRPAEGVSPRPPRPPPLPSQVRTTMAPRATPTGAPPRPPAEPFPTRPPQPPDQTEKMTRDQFPPKPERKRKP